MLIDSTTDARMALHAHYKAIRARLDAGRPFKPPAPPEPPAATEDAIIAALEPPEPEPVDIDWMAGARCLPKTRAMLEPILRKHGFTWTEAMEDRRLTPYVDARAEVYVALREAGWSYPTIGRLCGGRDHTTVLCAVNRYYARKETK